MNANISNQTSIATKKERNPFLPEWYLPNGTKNASENVLDGASESCERWSKWCGALVIGSVVAEFVITVFQPPYNLFLRFSIAPDAGVAIGIVGEVIFSMLNNRIQTELRIRSNQKVAEATDRATKADLARTELEAKLLPRMLNQEQWDFIQELRGKFDTIAVAYETDAETQWFVGQIRDAFFSAGIKVAVYPRAADVHTFGGILIFEPKGFDGARPRTVSPLVEIFSKTELVGSLVVITELPSDVLRSISSTRPEMRAPFDTPMIIVGGRFVIPPPHLEKAAKAAKAARDRMNSKP